MTTESSGQDNSAGSQPMGLAEGAQREEQAAGSTERCFEAVAGAVGVS